MLFDRGSAALSTGISVENDYLSVNGGLEGERSFNEKNTTLSGGLGVSVDTHRRRPTRSSFQRDDEENKQSGSLFVGHLAGDGPQRGDPEHAPVPARARLPRRSRTSGLRGQHEHARARHAARHAPPVLAG